MTTFCFTGDTAFSKIFKDSYKNEKLFSSEINDFLMSSDYTVVNIEGPLTLNRDVSGKDLVHSSSPQAAKKIVEINGNIWNLANNHVMDCGEAGLFDTLNAAKQNGCTTIGAGENLSDAMTPFIIEAEGGVGLFSVAYYEDSCLATDNTPGFFSWDDTKHIKKTIKDIKKKCRWCVMVVHGGEEFSYMPMPYIRKRYFKYLKYGADIIVAHHPHVIQNYEKVGNKMVFYSLGNFVMDTEYQRLHKYTDLSMLVKLKFTENDFDWECLSIKNNRESLTFDVTSNPAIFRNIDSKQYKTLWPLAVKAYLRNNKISEKYFKQLSKTKVDIKNDIKSESKIKKIIKLIKNKQFIYRIKRKFTFKIGEVFAKRISHDSIDKSLIDYINEKT